MADEDITFYSKRGEYLEDMFTLKDFLREPSTRAILEDNALKDFHSHISPKIEEYHNDVKEVAQKYSRIFHRDNRDLAAQEIIYAIFKNIEKKYELEVFYNNPSLATELLDKKK